MRDLLCDVCFVLFAVCLFVVCWLLCVVLFVVCRFGPVVRCLQCVASCSLFVAVYLLLYVGCCLQFAVRRLPFVVCCLLFAV